MRLLRLNLGKQAKNMTENLNVKKDDKFVLSRKVKVGFSSEDNEKWENNPKMVNYKVPYFKTSIIRQHHKLIYKIFLLYAIRNFDF